MDVIAAVLIVPLLLVVFVLALVALVQASGAASKVEALRREMKALEARLEARSRQAAVPPPTLEAPERRVPTPGEPRPAPPREVRAPVPPAAAQHPAHQPPLPPRPPAHAETLRTAEARPPVSRPAGPPPPPTDLATNLGPKLLVGVGALAFVVALAFFVKYAWENDWVGPTGRVLFGCVASLGLVAAGLRLLDHEYRPLGQGLAGAGLAGLYTSLYGAHAFYHLISGGADFVLLLGVTASALALSARLDVRLLASLAWIGAYLTPVLLSTGDDRALSLFAYLLLLGGGAMVLDRVKPWPETAPLAMIGTSVLYASWYFEFFRPERFGVAALGLALLTGVFAIGMARKERQASLVAAYLIAGIGLTLLGAQADRPWELLLLSLAVSAAALYAASLWGAPLAVAAGCVLALPFAAWALAHMGELSFAPGATWLAAATLLYVVAGASERVPLPIPMEGLALVVSALFTLALADVVRLPLPLLGLLAAQCVIAAVSQRRWAGAEPTAVLAAAIAIHGNYDRLLRSDGSPAGVLILTAGVFFAYLLLLTGRAFLSKAPISSSGAVVHLVNAALAWGVLFRLLYDTNPSALGLASLGLSVLYFLLGFVLLRSGQDLLHARTTLALAAGFVTLAIPVQLGLSGITLAWAMEGLVLLDLGVRFRSLLARAGGYFVLGLALVRLLARHTPLHRGEFVPVLNASFGTWLAVILALGIALYIARSIASDPSAEDSFMRPVLGTVLLVLLFGLLTAETQSAFQQQATAAIRAGDSEALRDAVLMGGLAVSVLWGLFATGLLAVGLALRNRPLFYSAYALFAVTAGKVVLVDLAELQTLYRILSFLVLGVLLMAGAYLNIRFRERLEPRGAHR